MNKPPKKVSKPSPKADEQRMVLASISKKEATAILLTKKLKLEKEIADSKQAQVEQQHKQASVTIGQLEAEIIKLRLRVTKWKAFRKSPSIKTCPVSIWGSTYLTKRLHKVNAQLASLKLIEGENILLTVVAVQALFDDE